MPKNWRKSRTNRQQKWNFFKALLLLAFFCLSSLFLFFITQPLLPCIFIIMCFVYTLCAIFCTKKKSCLYVNCICTYIYRVSVCRVSVYLVSGKHVSNKSRIFLQFLLLLLLGARDNGSAISTRKSISRI